MKKRKPLLITALTALLLLPCTAWAEGYPVRIGEEQLTSENIGNYPGVEYDPSTKKLILNGVKLTESISRMLDDTNWSYFTIVLKGKNSITVTTGGPCIYYEGVNATPAIVLERGDDACSLSLSCQNGSNVMEEFTNTIGTQIDLNEDLHDDKIKWIWFVEKTEEKNSVTYITQASMAIPYDISFGNGGTIVKQIHSGNASDVYGDKTDTSGPTVSFNPDNNTLTLNEASLDFEGIVSGLDNLTIHLKGTNYIGTDTNDPVKKGISSTVSTTKLTFTSPVNENNEPTGMLVFENVLTPIDGCDNIYYENDLAFGTDENGNKAVMYFENYLEINGVRISDDYSANGKSGTIAYSKNDKTITLTNYQENFEGDAIVTSIVGLKVKLAGKSSITIPDEAHAFRAMLAASSIKFMKDGNGSEELTVTTSDTPFKNFSNENVTYDGLICFQSGNNKWTIEALPATPEIAYDDTKTYFDTDKIVITGPENTTIFYTWGDAKIGTEYTHSTDNPTLTLYTAPGAAAQTGTHTLRAWAGKTIGANRYLMSEAASATYIIYKVFTSPYQQADQIWATYFNAKDDMTLPDNLEAYFITDIGETALSITQLDYLPKKVPVLIKKTGDLTGAKYTEYTGNPSTVSFENIILKYATDPIGATGKQYVLFNNEFVKATGSIPAGRCYIELDSNSGNVHARSLSIGDGNGTTGVESGEWSMINGQWYDLQGRRIQKPAKSGLYIVKGKLVMYNNK